MALERELETYRRELPKLIQSEGRFVVVHESEIAGTYDTYRDALKVGYSQFGLLPFLVKKIEAVESVLRFNREVWPT